MPSRLIFLNLTLSHIQRDTCPTCVNNTIMYSRHNTIMYSRHAPITTKSMSQKSPATWLIPDILQYKRRRCYLERVWHKSRSHLDRSRYSKQCHYCNTQTAKAKSNYYPNIVSNNVEDQLWNCINTILPRVPAPTLPSHVSIKYFRDSFSSHFKNKIRCFSGSYFKSCTRGLSSSKLSTCFFYICYS